MKKLLLAVSILICASALYAEKTTSSGYVYSGPLVNEKVSYSKNYDLDVVAANVDVLTFQAVYSSATPKTITFNDGVIDLTANTIYNYHHGYNTALPLLFSVSSGAAPTGLTTGTTYYAIPIDDFYVKLATTSARAISGLAVDITAVGTGDYALTPLAFAGTPSFKWQYSNDNVNWLDMNMSGWTYTGAGSTLWDFGATNYRYIRLKYTAGTAGALSLVVTGDGKTQDLAGWGIYVPFNNATSDVNLGTHSLTANSIKITSGAVNGYILTSDSSGVASWRVNSSANIINSTNTWTAPNTFSMPVIMPSGAVNGYVLTTDGSGNATWQLASASTGLLNSTNTWTAPQTFNSSTTFKNNVGVSSITFNDGTVINSTSAYNFQPQITALQISTGAIQASLNNVIVSTGVIQASLNNVIISTGAIQTSLNSVIVSTGDIQSSLNAVIVSTGAIQNSLNQVITSTGNIQSSLNNVIVSTGALQTSKVPYTGATGNVDLGVSTMIAHGYQLIIDTNTEYLCRITGNNTLWLDSNGNGVGTPEQFGIHSTNANAFNITTGGDIVYDIFNVNSATPSVNIYDGVYSNYCQISQNVSSGTIIANTTGDISLTPNSNIVNAPSVYMRQTSTNPVVFADMMETNSGYGIRMGYGDIMGLGEDYPYIQEVGVTTSTKMPFVFHMPILGMINSDFANDFSPMFLMQSNVGGADPSTFGMFNIMQNSYFDGTSYYGEVNLGEWDMDENIPMGAINFSTAYTTYSAVNIGDTSGNGGTGYYTSFYTAEGLPGSPLGISNTIVSKSTNTTLMLGNPNAQTAYLLGGDMPSLYVIPQDPTQSGDVGLKVISFGTGGLAGGVMGLSMYNQIASSSSYIESDGNIQIQANTNSSSMNPYSTLTLRDTNIDMGANNIDNVSSITVNAFKMPTGAVSGYELLSDVDGNGYWGAAVSPATDLRLFNNVWTGTNQYDNTSLFNAEVTVDSNIVVSGSITFNDSSIQTTAWAPVIGSSVSSSEVVDINSLSDIWVSTISLTLTGGKQESITGDILIENGSSGTRTYTVSVYEGTNLLRSVACDVRATSHLSCQINWFVSSSSSGALDYTIRVHCSNTLGTQTVTSHAWRVLEE